MGGEEYIPFINSITNSINTNDIIKDPIVIVKETGSTSCDHCPNNHKNGGDGICQCASSTPKIS